jgi:hypothetical protein
MTAANPNFGGAMTQLGGLFSSIFAAHRKIRTGSAVTNKDVRERRELAVAEFKGTWAAKPDAVVIEAALCNAWRGQFESRFATGGDIKDERELIRVVGEPPSKPPPAEVDKWRGIVPQAFAAWQALDYDTPSAIQERFRQTVMGSQKRP